MNRRDFLTLSAKFLATTVSLAEAQQSGKVFRIGYLDPSSMSGAAPRLERIRQRLRELGWV